MRTTTLSLLALIRWDPDLLDNLQLPADMDAEVMQELIIRRSENFEILYPDPVIMAYHIRMWSLRRLPVWEKLLETLNYEYNPIHNYDMNDDWTETGSGTSAGTLDVSTGIDRSAYDGIGSVPLRRVEETSTDNDTTGSYDNTLTHTQHRSGNIGVMSTQELIERQRDIVNFSVYDVIADEFAKEFCILVY